MSDLSITIVEGYHVTHGRLDLSGTDFWGIALGQRAVGPGRLVVVAAHPDGTVVGLAHCRRGEMPELALQCCLAALDDGAAAAVSYSDEPVTADPPIGVCDRLDTARAAAGELGVHQVDWVMCDDTRIRSMRLTSRTSTTGGRRGPPWATPHQGDPRDRSSQQPRRSGTTAG